jgi:biopolymer transport protein TolQ
MNGAEDALDIVTATSAVHDFSIMSMFYQASLTVKLVIILLVFCSFWSWTIIFAKISVMKRLKLKADRFEEAFWHSLSIDAFYDGVIAKKDDPFAAVFIAGIKEWRKTKNRVKSTIGALSLTDRIGNVMRVTVGREIDYLEQYVGFLATVGSTAPFVGLFGTVWGIMNSFESIGMSSNTSLTAVAPGISEALFATALGLVVTVPAVVAYNKICSDINRYQNRLEAFVDEFSAIVLRQLEDTSE